MGEELKQPEVCRLFWFRGSLQEQAKMMLPMEHQ